MKVICSWCKSEGLVGFVREKIPFADVRETHGICDAHLRDMGNGLDSLVLCNGDSAPPRHETSSRVECILPLLSVRK